MGRYFTGFVFVLCRICCAFAQSGPASQNLLANTSLSFEENKGQVADTRENQQLEILYVLKATGMNVYFTREGIFYQWHYTKKIPDGSLNISEATGRPVGDHSSSKRFPKPDSSISYAYRIAMNWMNANKDVEVVAEEPNRDYSNYYLAHCPKGVLGVRSFKKLTYKDLYPGVDVIYYIRNNHLKYDVVIHEDGDVNKVKFNYVGAEPKLVHGKLRLETPLGFLEEQKPVSYYKSGDQASIHYGLSKGQVSFRTSRPTLDNQELTIDPQLLWGTYYGGNGDEDGTATTVDLNNNIFLAGVTGSSANIASGGMQMNFGGVFDAYLVKFDANGTRKWATYYGGTANDSGDQVTSDTDGKIYLVGRTESNSGIALGGYQNTFGGLEDAFLAKFNQDGSLIWATYYGGPGQENGYTVKTDVNNNVFIGGYSSSTTDISLNGYQNTLAGGYDGLLVKFNSAGVRQWATYFGGPGTDQITSIDFDRNGNIFIGGITYSTSGIASGGYQMSIGGDMDSFLAKFDSSLVLQWATYYGGPGVDSQGSAMLDSNGDVYLAGSTSSVTNISFNGTQNNYGGGPTDGFLVKFDNSGNRLWATYYGGEGNDAIGSMAIVGSQYVFVAGYSESTTGIAGGGFQDSLEGAADAVVAKFNSSGDFQWGTYYGGSESYTGGIAVTTAYSINIDSSGSLYFSGSTASFSGIAFNGFQNSHGDAFNSSGIAAYDAFLVKLNQLPGKTDQRIAFQPISDVTLGDSAFSISAVAETNLPVGFASSSGKVTINGSWVSIVSAGRDTITASQPGNSSFNAAPAVGQSFCVRPSKPSVTISNANSATPLLTSSAKAGNQWFLNDVSVPAATDSILQATTTGIYKVQAHVDDCYSIFSNDAQIVITGLSSLTEQLSLYPNPSHDFLIIQGIPHGVDNSVIIDLMGRSTPITLEKQDDLLKADIHALPVGMYLLKVTGSHEIHLVRFIKQ